MKTRLRKVAQILFISLFVSLLLSPGVTFGQTSTSSSGTSSGATPDVIRPSDVENVKAVPGEAEVALTWEVATDNVGVIGYKIFYGTEPVKDPSQEYNLPSIAVPNVNTFTVKNLTNGQPYYFAVVAVDAAGNESESYSHEVSVVPQAGLGGSKENQDNGKPPEVKEVKSLDLVTVQVVFSEPVILPVEGPPQDAFKIERIDTKVQLKVQDAKRDTSDEKGQTVLLTTEPQEEEKDYVLTAGIQIEDAHGNPIVSGTSDTGSFKGSGKQILKSDKLAEEGGRPAGDTEDKTPPEVKEVKAVQSNLVKVTFSEKVVVSTTESDKQFTITKKGSDKKLKILRASTAEYELREDGETVFLTTDPQEDTDYELKITDLKDEAGNSVKAPEEGKPFTFKGKAASIRDLIPPEDVKRLVAKIKDAKEGVVTLTWQASKNSAGDLADQLFYQSTDRGKTYGTFKSLGKEGTSTEVTNLTVGTTYTFKITAKDLTGNESKGTTVSIRLPEVGPEILLYGFASLIGAVIYRKRKNKR